MADALPRLAARTNDEVRVWDALSELRPCEGQLEQCKHGRPVEQLAGGAAVEPLWSSWPVELAGVNTIEKKLEV